MALWGFKPEHTPAQNMEFYLTVEQAENDEREQLLDKIITIEHQLHNLIIEEYGKLKKRSRGVGIEDSQFFIKYTQKMIALLVEERKLLSRMSACNSEEIDKEKGAYRVIISSDRKGRLEQLRRFKKIS